MVAAARLATGLSGLRNRNTRVTNKTQLRVVKGNVDTDPIILDDDEEEKNRILASQGVDEEDANEHHLQAALFASSQRTLSTAHYKSETTATEDAFIPTPDAGGLVAEYDKLYPPKQYKDPTTHLRFSDSIDESCIGGLAGSFTYFLDERDAEWLARNNGAAKGEGTSVSGGGTHPATVVPLRGTPRVPHARSSKAKGKEPEPPPLSRTRPGMIIDEDHFELIMGLFEKWTDEIVSPYLQLDTNLEHFPDFNNYESYFAAPLSSSVFANFEVPSELNFPEKMVQLAKTIYPWWKERRMERKGKAIVPQLNVLILEAQEKQEKICGSPYTCFRKRDAKPMRKTRTNNVTYTEKLTRVRVELQNSLELAQMVVQREKLKRESVCYSAEIWRSRDALAQYMKQVNRLAPGSIPSTDELLLFDKEPKSHKLKTEGVGAGRIVLSTNRRPSHIRGSFLDSLGPHSPLMLNGDTSHAFEECQKRPSARTADIQHEVEHELLKARKDDAFWEDIVDMPYQSMSSPSAEKLYKPFPLPDNLEFSPLSISTCAADHDDSLTSSTSRIPRSLRLRTGRGGRLHLDRRLHITKPHRLLHHEWAGYPSRVEDVTAAKLHTERWASRSWRPREVGVRQGPRKRKIGEDYWSHRSMFNGVDLSDSRVPNMEGIGSNFSAQVATFGIEQSISGWDARELWARARATRVDEGWKPSPHLVIDPENLGLEVSARNAAERERVVEAWRGKTIDGSKSDGGALALFTDGGAMTQPNKLDGENRQPDDSYLGSWNVHGADAIHRAWKLDERWKHDSENYDADDRFLLDDYQPKFLRTAITLLDVKDQESIKSDPQYLTPPPLKNNRYPVHQLLLQPLPQPSSSVIPSSTTPHPTPLHQIPPSFPVSLASPVTNGTGVHSQTLSLDSTTSQNGNNNLTTNGNVPSGSTLNRNSAWPRSNNTIVPVSTRAPLPASNIRMNGNPVRIKQTNGAKHAGSSSTLTNGVNNHSNTHLNARFPAPPLKGYTSLKATHDPTMAVRPDPQVQQSGRHPYQSPMLPINGLSSSEHTAMNASLGVGNLHLKVQTQRTMSAQANNVENKDHGDIIHSDMSPPKQTSDSYSVTQSHRFSLPHLPSTNTRTA